MSAEPTPACQEALHVVAMVRGRPTSTHFAMHGHWPLPWRVLIPPDERHLMALMTAYCTTFATTARRRSRYVHGYEWFYVHCHCDRPHSLQCRSAGVYFQRLLKECVLGTAFDRRFWYYRAEMTKLSTSLLSYAGSVYLRGVHLIYLTGAYRIHLREYVRQVNWGEHLWIEAADGTYLVLVCRSCGPLSEVRVNCCLRRLRRRFVTLLSLLPREARERAGGYRRRDWHLIRLCRFGTPVPRDEWESSVTLRTWVV